MTDQNIAVDTAVNNLITMVQNQLGNVLSMIDTQVPLVNDALNADTDEYNAIIEQLEETTNALTNETLKVHEASITNENIKHEFEKQSNQHLELCARQSKLITRYELELTELKKLRSLNPERLKKKNIELSKTIKEKTEALATLRKRYVAEQKANMTYQRTVAEQDMRISQLVSDSNHMQQKLLHHDGDVEHKVFHGKNGLDLYIYQFEWGLTFHPFSNDFILVNDLDWHLEVRTNKAVGLLISCTEWMNPYYPPCSQLLEDWPDSDDLHDALVDVIRTRLLESHPDLVDRADWAAGFDVRDVPGITDKQADLINDSGLHSLLAICRMTSKHLEHHVKGFGAATAKQVFETCRDFAYSEWNRLKEEKTED